MGPSDGPRPGVTEVHEAAFRTSPVLSCVLAGPDLTALAANHAFRDWLGASVPVGASMREPLAAVAGRQMVRRVERVRDTEHASVHEAWVLRGHRPDGTPQELVADVVIEPWRHGDLPGVVVHLVDLTHHLAGVDDRSSALAPMQDALILAEVPLLPGFAVAARYLLAGQDGRAGGDWFDVVPRPEGRLALVVGDVPGQGTGGAAVMASLQAVLRERLLAGIDPARAITLLDEFAVHVSEASGATVGVVEVDPHSGDLRYALAGHPPPLVVGADGSFRFLPPLGGRPLAMRGRYHLGHDRLGGEEQVLLYSDGLLERQDRTSVEGPVELAGVAAAAYADALRHQAGVHVAEHSASALLDGLVGRAGHRDDVALVVGHRTPEPPPLRLDLDGSAVDGGTARTEVTTWLATLGARLVDRVAVLRAIDELLDNAVRHGIPTAGPDARVRIDGRLDDHGTMELCVHDPGHWREPDPARRGRGLMVAGSLVDHLHVHCDAAGSTVTLRHRLTRQAEMLERPRPLGARHTAGATSGEGTLSEVPGGVRVHGWLDGESVAELRLALLRLSQAGCRGVAVDLTGATYVGGTAVSVLFEALARCEDHGEKLTVLAAPGSAAQHVLEVVALPYETGDGGSDDPFTEPRR